MRYQITSDLFEAALHGAMESDGVEVEDSPAVRVLADDQDSRVFYALLDGKRIPFVAQIGEEGEIVISMRGYNYRLHVRNERDMFLQSLLKKTAVNGGGPASVKSPMPGLIKSVDVALGDEVTKGARLLVLEAMKMENDIVAQTAGRITKLQVEAGMAVEKSQLLCEITPPKE